MKKPVKLQDVQTATYWNDTHKLTLIFQPLDDVTEPPIDPPIEPINIPTGIKLSTYNI